MYISIYVLFYFPCKYCEAMLFATKKKQLKTLKLRNQKEKLKKCAENKTSEEKKLDSHTTCPVG
jgi:hypothetical protein